MQPLVSPPATPHSTHDLLLLAAAVDRHPDDATRAADADQVARCAECAALAAELRAVSTGLAGLPASRRAPRDMRLSGERAAQLRRGRIWRRLLRPFGAEGLPGLRPLAGALTTLGLAGILLTALPLGFPASGGASLDAVGNPVAGPTARDNEAGAPVPAVTSDPGAEGGPKVPASPPPAMAGDSGGNEYSKATAGSVGGLVTSPPSAPAADGTGMRLPPLGIVSVILALAGLGLFGVLLAARRLA